MKKWTFLPFLLLLYFGAKAQNGVRINICPVQWETSEPIDIGDISLLVEKPGNQIAFVLYPTTNTCTEILIPDSLLAPGNTYFFNYLSLSGQNNTHNGVTVFDTHILQNHLLGISPVQNAFGFLSADLDNSRAVTPTDIIEIRKSILGISTFSSWGMLSQDCVTNSGSNPFTDPCNGLTVSDLIALNNQNFYLFFYKRGDLDGDAFATKSEEYKPTYTTQIPLIPTDKVLQKDEEFDIIFSKSTGSDNIFMYQMEFYVDPTALDVVDASTQNGDIYLNQPSLTDNYRLLGNYKPQSGGPTANELFTFTVKALKDDVRVSDFINIQETNIPAMATSGTNANPTYAHLDVDFTSGLFETQTIAVQSSAFPNPYTLACQLSFYLKSAQKAHIQLFDLMGKQVWTKTLDVHSGQNIIDLPLYILQKNNSLMYMIQTEEGLATGRLIHGE